MQAVDVFHSLSGFSNVTFIPIMNTSDGEAFRDLDE
jgi:hypothetical protein